MSARDADVPLRHWSNVRLWEALWRARQERSPERSDSHNALLDEWQRRLEGLRGRPRRNGYSRSGIRRMDRFLSRSIAFYDARNTELARAIVLFTDRLTAVVDQIEAWTEEDDLPRESEAASWRAELLAIEEACAALPCADLTDLAARWGAALDRRRRNTVELADLTAKAITTLVNAPGGAA